MQLYISKKYMPRWQAKNILNIVIKVCTFADIIHAKHVGCEYAFYKTLLSAYWKSRAGNFYSN